MKIIVPVIVITWILSLASTLAMIYFAPGLFTVRSEQIPDGLITSSKIADEAIVTTKLDNGAVTSAKIQDGTVTAQDLADGSIISVNVAAGAVETSKIADGAVTGVKIADGAIVTLKLANGSITSAKILDGSITAVDLADGSIVSSKVVDGAITTTKIADGSVTTAKIANGAVTSDKILDGTVSSADLGDRSVTTAKIADGSVTGLKLSSNAIPFDAVNSTVEFTTQGTVYADMPAYYTPTYRAMYVTVSVERASDLWIMFSADAYNTANSSIWVRAIVNEYSASPRLAGPSDVLLTRDNRWDSQACNFYYHVSAAGTYTVHILWRVEGGTGHVSSRALAVIAIAS